jgi:hypothetical protein
LHDDVQLECTLVQKKLCSGQELAELHDGLARAAARLGRPFQSKMKNAHLGAHGRAWWVEKK